MTYLSSDAKENSRETFFKVMFSNYEGRRPFFCRRQLYYHDQCLNHSKGRWPIEDGLMWFVVFNVPKEIVQFAENFPKNSISNFNLPNLKYI